MEDKNNFVLIENARTKFQRDTLERIKKDGVCPFCPEYFKTYHTKPILKETDSWFLTTNFAPYEGAVHHFLFVYKPSHINTPSEMTNESKIELFDLVEEITKEYKLKGGSIFMRFGDGSINGSSVEHLHAHVIIGVKKTENTEGLKVKLGYKNK